ncbi:ECF transporter S component [Lactiplantibacillus mudanjiangensis]|uniref:Integral membrane protein [Lactobacillus plantarum JDM1] n=1 Tax=Lactiplantibacillus mudanjiangensis TaxID=1296538 RepID=A0A660DVM9_9LACO|nr:ECF transporter S component [Lactiplantibacillus mudanjiangensis]VDG20021.1 integral membrane protein [Lactobacillus plantarum JDM1] [Lactiplantibacillus mudanjiangensis]VDG26182.1 integral membrane protein [Lactobacillus plantarum JDM1] [Lactiplantibacillus mudanjiangensis]VDG27335.1 integral membrane protein [Lactobacillus plantarum JDM1] [Lactiplantibacillus mudanjiangensis]VDG33418.1 integral membrane protein [Lactobacillus plantarum JDM1] [Lactiplantibacillus mudanjiangensis]
MKLKVRTLTLLALCIALNIVGSNIALMLKLPIYLDSIGTVLAAAVFGPLGGMVAGGATGLIVGATTDLYSLFFMPVQLVTGLVAGFVYRRVKPASFRQNWWLALVVSLPGTLLSTLITVMLFHGITSSGSSMLVQVLLGTGLSKPLAVFVIQIGTDYLDRFLTVYVVALVYRALRYKLPQQLN